MGIRRACARNFYPEASHQTIQGYVYGFAPPGLDGKPAGAVVPHAGWVFSGQTAARVFYTLKENAPETSTFVFLGAVHRVLPPGPAVDSSTAWETPLGEIGVDENLRNELLEAAIGLEQDSYAHQGEHSIEVSLPFIRHFFPKAALLPVVCPPSSESVDFGTSLGKALKGKRVIVVASTDLTHYGSMYGFTPAGLDAEKAMDFLRNNDKRMLDLVCKLEASKIVPESQSNMNACGSGALAASVAAARAMGAKEGKVVEYTTSFDKSPDRSFSHAVGYGGIVMF